MRRELWIPFSLLLIAGCSVSTSTSTTTTTSPSAESSENTTTDSGEEKPDHSTGGKAASETNPKESDTAKREVTLIDDTGPLFAKYLEENKGKVILVDCWATWCGPCKEGFPSTVALHEKHKDDGLVVVSVSFDDISEDEAEKKSARDGALKFLQEKKATFKNFLAKTGFGDDSGKPFGVTLALPAFRVIDRQGKDRLDPKLSHEEIEKQLPDLIAQLLKEPA